MINWRERTARPRISPLTARLAPIPPAPLLQLTHHHTGPARRTTHHHSSAGAFRNTDLERLWIPSTTPQGGHNTLSQLAWLTIPAQCPHRRPIKIHSMSPPLPEPANPTPQITWHRRWAMRLRAEDCPKRIRVKGELTSSHSGGAGSTG